MKEHAEILYRKNNVTSEIDHKGDGEYQDYPSKDTIMSQFCNNLLNMLCFVHE